MVPVDITNNEKRNPWREFPIEREERKQKRRGAANDSDSEIDEFSIPTDNNLLVADTEFSFILKKKQYHNDVIKSIQYISCADKPLILTGSTDRLVHLIDLETSAIVGTLKQGYKSMMNYQWDFPVSGHLATMPQRKTRIETILEEVRAKRDADLSTKKFKEI